MSCNAAALEKPFATLKPKLEGMLRGFPDFPIPGILFRDIMPIFKQPDLVRELVAAVIAHCKALPTPVTAVAAMEARGFLFGPQVACGLNVPFVAIRKKNKLPGPVISATYEKEYGSDTLEIQADAFTEGADVVILDDLIAVGGTMSTAIHLVQKAKCNVIEAFCLIELCDLNGTARLPPNVPFFSVLKFK